MNNQKLLCEMVEDWMRETFPEDDRSLCDMDAIDLARDCAQDLGLVEHGIAPLWVLAIARKFCQERYPMFYEKPFDY